MNDNPPGPISPPARAAKHFARESDADVKGNHADGKTKTTIRGKSKFHLFIVNQRLAPGDSIDLTEDEFAQHAQFLELVPKA